MAQFRYVSPLDRNPEFETNMSIGILWVYCIFNIAAALVLYWLVRMPKTKKDKKDKKEVGGHKGAVQEQVLDEPSRVGSRVSATEKHTVEHETRRYASITGDTTPPRREGEISNEKL